MKYEFATLPFGKRSLDIALRIVFVQTKPNQKKKKLTVSMLLSQCNGIIKKERYVCKILLSR